MDTKRVQWSGRVAFILATAGSAIGLGNIWKFPYIAGINGGGAFVLIYLVCIALVGIPIMIAEMYIGQRGQKNAVTSFEVLDKKGTWWRMPGFMGIVSAFLILSFYSVVGGWILDFEFRALLGNLVSMDEKVIGETLSSLLKSPWRQLFWHTLFMGITCYIVAAGIRQGLERWNNVLMPVLLLLLLILLARVLFLPGFGEAMSFLFTPDFSKLTGEGILEAVGHSFFTLSLGMGAIITYGSYLKEGEDLQKISLIVAFMDTIIALIAGVVIFSVVFSFNMEPGAGPGLIFSTLPVLLSKMQGGSLMAVGFFLLVAFAALTSAVSLLEVVVAYWDETQHLDRKRGAVVSSVSIYLVGILSVLSTNILANVKIFDLTFFDLFDKLTSSYLLPVGGLLISLFFGWKLGSKAVEEVVGSTEKKRYHVLLWSTRVVAPLAVCAILIHKFAG
ncbi:MAG: sodium-dependent transporter [Nitrospinota bacterium]